MGTRPEDMRYRVEVAPDTWQGPGWAASRVVPWLVIEESDGAVSWVAPVHVLRVALQKQQRHEELVAYCSRLIAPNPGVAVRAVSGADSAEVVFEGRAVGYQDLPSVIVELVDGSRRQWVASLVRPVVPTAVWDDGVAPGGMVCVECGVPVESEPCAEHGAMPASEAVVREVPVRRRAEAVDPELVAERLLAGGQMGGDQGSTGNQPGSGRVPTPVPISDEFPALPQLLVDQMRAAYFAPESDPGVSLPERLRRVVEVVNTWREVAAEVVAHKRVASNQMSVEQARTWLLGPGAEGGSQR